MIQALNSCYVSNNGFGTVRARRLRAQMISVPQMIPKLDRKRPKTGNDSSKSCRKISRMAWTPWKVYGCIFTVDEYLLFNFFALDC